MLKIRRSQYYLIFNMGIPIDGKTVFIMRQGSESVKHVHTSWDIQHTQASSMLSSVYLAICIFLHMIIFTQSLILYYCLNPVGIDISTIHHLFPLIHYSAHLHDISISIWSEKSPFRYHASQIWLVWSSKVTRNGSLRRMSYFTITGLEFAEVLGTLLGMIPYIYSLEVIAIFSVGAHALLYVSVGWDSFCPDFGIHGVCFVLFYVCFRFLVI